MKKRIILSVTNDLFSDQRVDKTCHSLLKMGFDVHVIGRRYRNSPTLSKKPYSTQRMHLLFKTGPLFYAEFNLRLFFLLLFTKVDILYANDLDALLPNILISKLRNKKIVYDSHEYFCGILEIQHRPKVKKTWEMIERFCFPKLTSVITVSDSIAQLYEKQYGKKVRVIRNIPPLRTEKLTETRESLHLPTNQKIIILQGNAIHKDRGGEEIVESMPLIENAILIIVGGGDMIPYLKKRVQELHIEQKIIFTGRVKPQLLRNYTALADIGIAFDKNVSPNHYYSLPNKLFEYIHAGTPIISSNLPERRKIVEQYQVGKVVENLVPEEIAKTINLLLNNNIELQNLKERCLQARQELNWENEETMFFEIEELQ